MSEFTQLTSSSTDARRSASVAPLASTTTNTQPVESQVPAPLPGTCGEVPEDSSASHDAEPRGGWREEDHKTEGMPVTEAAGPPPVIATPKVRTLAQERWSSLSAFVKTMSALKSVREKTHMRKIFGGSIDEAELRDTKINTPWMVHPNQPWRKQWDMVMTLALVYSVFATPYELAFSFHGSFSGDSSEVAYAIADTLVMIFFFVDIVINFRTALITDDEIEEDSQVVMSKYLRGWFTIDFVSTVPWETVVAFFVSSSSSSTVAWSAAPKVLKSLRLLHAKVARLASAFSLEIGTIARLLQVLFWMVLVGHLMGCAWYFMAEDRGLGSGTWADDFHMEDKDRASRYLMSVYWAFVTVTTVGYGDVTPVNDAERVFVIMCTFVGNGIFAFMIGRVTALASQMNASHQLFVEKLDSVNEFMHYRNLPPALRARIRAFYHSFWNRGIYFNEQTILGDLTFELQKEVTRFLNLDLVRNVPFFIGMEDQCVNAIIKRLVMRHALAGDTIVRENEYGEHLFVLRRGLVSVSTQGVIRHYLSRGSFFGEVCLVYPHMRRSATLTALTPCELASLNRLDYEDIVTMFPAFHDVMMRIASAHLTFDDEKGNESESFAERLNLLTGKGPGNLFSNPSEASVHSAASGADPGVNRHRRSSQAVLAALQRLEQDRKRREEQAATESSSKSRRPSDSHFLSMLEAHERRVRARDKSGARRNSRAVAETTFASDNNVEDFNIFAPNVTVSDDEESASAGATKAPQSPASTTSHGAVMEPTAASVPNASADDLPDVVADTGKIDPSPHPHHHHDESAAQIDPAPHTGEESKVGHASGIGISARLASHRLSSGSGGRHAVGGGGGGGGGGGIRARHGRPRFSVPRGRRHPAFRRSVTTDDGMSFESRLMLVGASSFRYDHGGFGGNSVPTTLQGHGRPRPALELNQAPSPLARPWRFGDLSRDPARDPNRTRGLSPSHRQSATSPTSPLNQPARKKSTLATPEGQFQTSVLAALAGIRAELKTLRTDVNDLMQIR